MRGAGEGGWQGGERKQGNATEVRTLFLAGRKLVLFPSLQLADIFRKLDQLQKNKKVPLCLIIAAVALMWRDPASPPAALGTDEDEDDDTAAGNNAEVQALISPTKT